MLVDLIFKIIFAGFNSLLTFLNIYIYKKKYNNKYVIFDYFICKIIYIRNNHFFGKF